MLQPPFRTELETKEFQWTRPLLPWTLRPSNIQHMGKIMQHAYFLG